MLASFRTAHNIVAAALFKSGSMQNSLESLLELTLCYSTIHGKPFIVAAAASTSAALP